MRYGPRNGSSQHLVCATGGSNETAGSPCVTWWRCDMATPSSWPTGSFTNCGRSRIQLTRILQKGFAPTQRRLAEMGYVEGRNLVIEYLAADSQEDRLATLAGELVQRRVDAIAVFAGQSIVAAKAATTTIPIIFLTGFDPVASRFVASLNRPGGNVTGISVLNTQVLAKRLEMLRELIPTAKTLLHLQSDECCSWV
jgi:ABC transporter substrate binding protein